MKHKKISMLLLILSLVMSNGYFAPAPARAASITSAYDRLSDSNPTSVATHNITFTTATTTEPTDYIEVTLADFSDIPADGNITCPAGFTGTKQAAKVARCTKGAGSLAAGTSTIVISGLINPTQNSYHIIIDDKKAGGALKESVDLLVAIIDHVTLKANVPSAFTFVISPLDAGVGVNGATTTKTSATTTLDFGNLEVGTTSIMGQELKVTTNSNYGYKVTVEQNQDLTSNSGSNIDSFDEGTAPGAPKAWEAPVPVLDSKNTYGHMGFTTEDASLSTGDTYGSALFMGFTATNTQEVMFHNGTADGLTENKGETKVAYQIEISALQEAGDYTNILTYIATPTF